MQAEPSFRGNLVCEAFWSFEFLSFGIISNFVLRYSNFRLMSNHALPPFRGLPNTTGSTSADYLWFKKKWHKTQRKLKIIQKSLTPYATQ